MPNPASVPFYIHSTFRNYAGTQAKPRGLQWGMDADSYLTYVPANEMPTDLTSPATLRGIVEAHNRWAYAKGKAFRCVEDVRQVSSDKDGIHLQVDWKEARKIKHERTCAADADGMEALLKQAATAAKEPAEVWVNGVYEGTLDGEMSLYPILMAIKRSSGKYAKLEFKQTKGLIRIEKYFRGMIRGHEVYEHVVDNLIALEDPEIIGAKALIGTATLPDWIMGGELTSRLYIEESDDGSLEFLRPLYRDDPRSSDRRFRLLRGTDDDARIEIVRKELDRLRYLATLKHPMGESGQQQLAVARAVMQ